MTAARELAEERAWAYENIHDAMDLLDLLCPMWREWANGRASLEEVSGPRAGGACKPQSP